MVQTRSRPRILKAIKISSTPSYGGEVKPEAPCSKILRRVNIASKHEQRYFEGQIHHFLRDVSPDFLPDDFTGRIGRELWWTNQEFSLQILFSHGSPCSYFTRGINNRPIGDSSSET
jgi:hypothetical protein